MIWVLVVVAAALTAVVAGVAIVAARQRSSVAAANQVVPGIATRAPASWAGSHDPEPRLHRRLRDAMTALRDANTLDDGTTIVLRAELEQSALAWDNRLVAIAALPPAHRTEQLPAATHAIESIEAAVAQYISAATQPAELTTGLAAVRARLDTAAELHRSLENG
ncbi:hypothetical protein [Nocardia nepalensis]|uniref:hypothetical protein n=1 Tax=Nocardia nepalensis TaxID=3375448 RepID=UPI003B68059C